MFVKISGICFWSYQISLMKQKVGAKTITMVKIQSFGVHLKANKPFRIRLLNMMNDIVLIWLVT